MARPSAFPRRPGVRPLAILLFLGGAPSVVWASPFFWTSPTGTPASAERPVAGPSAPVAPVTPPPRPEVVPASPPAPQTPATAALEAAPPRGTTTVTAPQAEPLSAEVPPPDSATFVEHLGPEAFPDRTRGLFGGSLWLEPSFHGLQWPYMPRSGVGVSGYVWADTSRETIDRGTRAFRRPPSGCTRRAPSFA